MKNASIPTTAARNASSALARAAALSVLAFCIAGPAAQAAEAAKPAAAAMSPAKQKLVERVLELWHIEALGQAMLQAPVADAVSQARVALQGRAAPEKRDAAMRDITEEANKFLKDSAPLVNDSAKRQLAGTVAPLLAERFTEDELKQLVALLESPVKKKFELLVPEVQKSLGEKIAAETKPQIEPKMKDLQQRIGMRLRTAVMP